MRLVLLLCFLTIGCHTPTDTTPTVKVRIIYVQHPDEDRYIEKNSLVALQEKYTVVEEITTHGRRRLLPGVWGEPDDTFLIGTRVEGEIFQY